MKEIEGGRGEGGREESRTMKISENIETSDERVVISDRKKDVSAACSL